MTHNIPKPLRDFIETHKLIKENEALRRLGHKSQPALLKLVADGRVRMFEAKWPDEKFEANKRRRFHPVDIDNVLSGLPAPNAEQLAAWARLVAVAYECAEKSRARHGHARASKSQPEAPQPAANIQLVPRQQELQPDPLADIVARLESIERRLGRLESIDLALTSACGYLAGIEARVDAMHNEWFADKKAAS
jgi:hypothetical protein